MTATIAPSATATATPRPGKMFAKDVFVEPQSRLDTPVVPSLVYFRKRDVLVPPSHVFIRLAGALGAAPR